jgi:manganese/zinc/iron transport system permease protein
MYSSSLLSPYWGKAFGGVLLTLLQRVKELLSGHSLQMATDELQLIVLVLLAVPTALLGLFISLRKMTMLANSISHTILLGIVTAYLLFQGIAFSGSFSLTALLVASFISAFITAIITEGCVKIFHLQQDASIGLIFTGLFSIGVILVSVATKNTHLGTEIIMGNIDALHRSDMQMALVLFLANLLFIFCFFKELLMTTFDPIFAKVQKMRPHLFHYLIIFFLAGSTIAAFRAVGIVLFLTFLVGPFLIVKLYTSQIKLLISGIIFVSIIFPVLGVALSRHMLTCYAMPCSTSGLVALLISMSYLVQLGFKSLCIRFKKKSFHEKNCPSR